MTEPTPTAAGEPRLEVRDLRIGFGERRVVDLERLDLRTGEIVGLAGESGSGKSITCLAVLGLVGTLGATVQGSIRLDGEELVGAPEPRLRQIRGRRIAAIFQSPVPSLDPLRRVGDLFESALRVHGAARDQARERAAEALRGVLLSPGLLTRYPHQLSGGQAQRVVIAIAVALGSDVLLADEPTSALDVTVQAEILDLLRRLRDERGMSVLFITHDLAVISELCDRLVVMRAGADHRGRVDAPAARRTAGRIHEGARRRGAEDQEESVATTMIDRAGAPLLEVEDLHVRFGVVRAVDGVSFSLPVGPFGLGLVGESGSGKTTIARALLRLVDVERGSIRLDGQNVLGLRGDELRAYRRTVQIVFQDPTTKAWTRASVSAPRWRSRCAPTRSCPRRTPPDGSRRC